MAASTEYEKVGNDTECGKLLNTFFVWPFLRGYVRVKGSGFILPDHFPEFGDQIKQLDIRDDDVFVCCYPKSGTTWVQEMVWCIMNDLDFKGAEANLEERFPFLERSGNSNYKKIMEERPDVPMTENWLDSIKFVDKMNSPRLIKTHLPFCLLPERLMNFSTKAKIIHICRNPKDTCVSLYHYSQTFEGYTGDFNTFCKLFLNDMIIYSPFWDHILQFWKQKESPRILSLKYEDMKKDLPSAVRQTASFLGKSLSDEQVVDLTNHLSFESMKRNRAVNREPRMEFNKKFNLNNQDGVFMRSGTTGSYKNEMTHKMIRQFE